MYWANLTKFKYVPITSIEVRKLIISLTVLNQMKFNPYIKHLNVGLEILLV